MAPNLDGSDPLVFLGALALLIGLGFVGNLIFSKLRFNDTLILIGVGVVAGPVTGLISPDSLAGVSSIVGPLALILILFDGGLALKVQELMHGLGSAAALGFIGFTLTFLVVGGVTAFALDIPIMSGLLLGAILGGTSALVVLPCLEHMDVKKKTGTTLGLESALTDVLVVVVSFTLISIVAAQTVTTEAVSNVTAASPAINDYAQGIAGRLLAAFALGILLGVIGGFLWLALYPRVRDKPFGYMLTLGFMFFLYVSTEWVLGGLEVSGGGPLAVLSFGVVLGNYDAIERFAKRVGEGFGTGMKKFQGEISFLVRTFFFVYLGILVEPELLADVKIIGIGILVFVAMLAARYLAVMATTRKLRLEGDDLVLWIMGPRGLAAAVLAAEPARQGVPGTESFVALAFMALVLSNLFSTVGTLLMENKGAPPPDKPAVAPAKPAPKAPTKPATKAPPRRTARSTTETGLESFGRKPAK